MTNAYTRYKAAANRRVKAGKSKWVKASDLEPGMLCRDHMMRFSHNEMQVCSGFDRNVICFDDGTGFVDNLDSMIEVVVETA